MRMIRTSAQVFLCMVAMLCYPAMGLATDLNLQPFSFTFNHPIGIDFHEPSGNLIMSANYPTGLPSNLNLVNSTNGSPTVFSGLSGLTDELKIATVRASTCQGGFAVGEVFTGNGQPGAIVRVSPTGAIIQNPWVTLPGEPSLLRGSLFQDRFCAAGGDLIVVTGDEQTGIPALDNVGNVWRITSGGVATKVATINHHLEGVITLPNDPNRYGPLAGKILAGDEDRAFPSGNGPDGKIWVINPNTGARFTVGHNTGAPACVKGLPAGCNYATAIPLQPEDLDLIRRNTDFFGVAFHDEKIFVARNSDLAASNFRDRCGQILVTQEFPRSATSGLAALRYSGSDSFIVDPLTSNVDGQITQWEHVTFTSGDDCLGGPSTSGRMTGGGSVFTSAGKRVTHGFELHCDITELPNNLEINWDGGNNFHLGALTSVICIDDPAIKPPPPNAGFDTLIGAGTGTLNGLPATIEFTLTDAGEPGTKDTAKYHIVQNGVVVLEVGPANLEKGNQQAHK